MDELKPWLWSASGHYTNLRILFAYIEELTKESKGGFPSDEYSKAANNIGLHYRIGDLISVKPDSLVRSEITRLSESELLDNLVNFY